MHRHAAGQCSSCPWNFATNGLPFIDVVRMSFILMQWTEVEVRGRTLPYRGTNLTVGLYTVIPRKRTPIDFLKLGKHGSYMPSLQRLCFLRRSVAGLTYIRFGS